MKTRTTKARKGYIITRESKSYDGFTHVNLSLVRHAQFDNTRPEFCALRLRWQATDKQSDRSDFYGLHVTVDTDTLEKLGEEQVLAAKIQRAMVGMGDQPSDFVATLEKMGFIRYVWDRRVSPDLVPIGEVLPIGWKRYMPDYNRLGWDSCIVSTVARDEEMAKTQLLALLATRENHWNADEVTKKTREFVCADSPVIIDTFANQPDLTPTDDIVRSPKTREANEHKTVAVA